MFLHRIHVVTMGTTEVYKSLLEVILNNALPALAVRLPIKLQITTDFMAAFCF